MNQPLHLLYRPASLAEVVGNRATVQSLQTLLERPDGMPHAWMFTGPSGCGKTTLARIVAGELGTPPRLSSRSGEGDPNPDFTEMDSADFRGIDTIRDLRRAVQYAPVACPFRVWLLDEVHQLSKDAQSALLKLLEDTPPHVHLLLATTDPDKLLPTIRNRCHTFTVAPLPESEMAGMLTRVARAEKIPLTDDILNALCDNALGSPRMGLVLMDKIRGLKGEAVREAVEQQAAETNKAIALCRALIKGCSWRDASTILKTMEDEPETVRRAVLGYASAVLLNSGNPRCYAIMQCFGRNTYDTGRAGLAMMTFAAISGRV